MKNKIIFCLIFAFVILLLTINMNSYAVTLPELKITSNSYSANDKFNLDEINYVEVENTLQLYTVIAYGNDMMVDNNPDSLGWFVYEANLSGVTWSSADNEIATVDNNGKVTGVTEGKTTITAKYNGESANYEIDVIAKSSSDFTGLVLVANNLTPQPALVLNKEYGFWIYLYNIPDTEKGNVKVTIDNEDVAKITEIDLCNWEDGSGKGLIIANTKFLSLGRFTITATLNYNGKVYSDNYTNGVAKSSYTLNISAKDYEELPSNLKIGDKIQLTATLGYVGAVLFEDVTTKVTWTSSNEEIATVKNGLISAKGEGKVTITAKYTTTDDSVTEIYEINITDSTKTPVNPGTTNEPNSTENPFIVESDPTTAQTELPQTGKSATTIFFGIVLIISIFVIFYKKHKVIK